MKSKIVAITAALAISSGAWAQANQDLNNFNAAVEEARTVIQTERKMLIIENMTMTDDEASKFWPLYDKYAAELKEVGNMRVNVIKKYAASYSSNSLTGAEAKKMIEDILKFQKKTVTVRESYLPKFRKILGDIKTARFYQIENKLDAITNLALAREIPLVPVQQ